MLVYLRASIPDIGHVLAALDQLELQFKQTVVCFVPDLPPDWPAKFPHLRFYREPLNLPQLLPRASLLVTHGSGTFADAVLQGVPVLMVASVIEQYLAGLRQERQGVGLVLHRRGSLAECVNAFMIIPILF